MDWYKISFSRDDLLQGRLEAVKEAVKQQLLSAGFPSKAALFQTQSTPLGVELYFSPEAAALVEPVITQWRGISCRQPDPAELLLVMGAHDARDRLFKP